jgi:hypothetical protein
MSILIKKKQKSKHEDSQLLNKKYTLKILNSFSSRDSDQAKGLKLFANSRYLKEDVDIQLVTLEALPLKSIKILRIFALFALNDNKTIDKKWRRMLDIIEDYLTPSQYLSYIENDRLYRVMAYGFSSGKNLGRLYGVGKKNFQNIPKLFRSFLLENDYTDVDLVNSHPTILAEYADKKELAHKTLRKLVLDRENFQKQVIKELGMSNSSNIKKAILIVINSSNYSGKSALLKELSIEMISIRNSIWQDFYVNSPENRAIFDKKSFFTKRSLDAQKLHIQSIFCFTTESRLLLSLYAFLMEKVKNETEELHFIPFFDGALIHFRNKNLHRNLPDWIDFFNSNRLNLHKFKVKKMEENLPDSVLENFKRIEKVGDGLKMMSRTDIHFIKKIISKEVYEGHDFSVFHESDLEGIANKALEKQAVYNEYQKKITELFRERREIKRLTDSPWKEAELERIKIEIDSSIAKVRSNRYYFLNGSEFALFRQRSISFIKLFYDYLDKYVKTDADLRDFVTRMRRVIKSESSNSDNLDSDL